MTMHHHHDDDVVTAGVGTGGSAYGAGLRAGIIVAVLIALLVILLVFWQPWAGGNDAPGDEPVGRLIPALIDRWLA